MPWTTPGRNWDHLVNAHTGTGSGQEGISELHREGARAVGPYFFSTRPPPRRELMRQLQWEIGHCNDLRPGECAARTVYVPSLAGVRRLGSDF